jgi:hypothetical protein
MSKEATHVDISNTPELSRLAEAVRDSMQPHILEKDGEALVVVKPYATKRAPKRTQSSVEAAVARLRATHGTVTPHQRPEDFRALREAFEEGVAAEVVAETS